MVGTGYIIESSYQRFLGTDTGFLGTTAYIASASEYLLDMSLLFTHSPAWHTTQVLAFIVLMLFASLMIRRHQARVQGVVGGVRRLAIVLVSALAFLNFWYYILPTVTVEGVLSGNIQPPVASGEKGFRAKFISLDARERPWSNLVCPHLSDTPNSAYVDAVALCKKYLPHNTLPSEFKSSQDYYADKVRANLVQYALNVGWLISFAILVWAAAGYVTVQFMDWETILMAALLFVNLLGLPFQYGKTARVRDVPYAAVYFNPQLKLGEFNYGLILYDADAGYTFMEPVAHKIWFVPRSSVIAVQTDRAEDIIGFITK